MTVSEAIQTLQDIRDNPDYDVPVNEFEAIGVAIVVLASLDGRQVKVIDSLLNSPEFHHN